MQFHETFSCSSAPDVISWIYSIQRLRTIRKKASTKQKQRIFLSENSEILRSIVLPTQTARSKSVVHAIHVVCIMFIVFIMLATLTKQICDLIGWLTGIRSHICCDVRQGDRKERLFTKFNQKRFLFLQISHVCNGF